ncbi:MAG: hypothetical protein ACI9YT_002867 [Halobacteriales archaeon]|jgi:hypothetical protein
MSSTDRADDAGRSSDAPEEIDKEVDRGDDPDFHRTDREITRQPTKPGITIAVVAATTASVFALFGGPSAFGVTMIGFAIFGFGLLGARRHLLDLGALGLFGGVAFGALQGAPVLSVLLGTVGTVVAWDAGETALSMGRQMGRETSTSRAETVRALVGTAVGLVAIGLGYAIFRAASGGQPTSALILMLLAVVLLVSGLRL